jgi:hypothetical protein
MTMTASTLSAQAFRLVASGTALSFEPPATR